MSNTYLYSQLIQIMNDADSNYSEPQIGVFTGEERTRWSNVKTN